MVTSMPDSFWHEMRGRFGQLPVWLPGTPMALGDVGELGRGGWMKATTLAALGIDFTPDAIGAATDIDYSSHDGVQVATHVVSGTEGSLPGVAAGHAALKFSFSRGEAFVFTSYGVQTNRISNLSEVDEGIRNAHSRQDWQPSWIAVFEVARGGPTIILVAQEAGAEAVVDLGVELPVGSVPLAQARAGLAVRGRHGLAGMFVTPEPATVMWRGRYVHRRGIFSGSSVRERGEAERDSTEALLPTVAELEFPDDVAAILGE
jgi:hypothetical protein